MLTVGGAGDLAPARMQVLRQHLSMKTVTLREAPLALGPALPTFLSQNVEEVHIVDLPPDLLPTDKGRKKMAGFDVDLDFMCACMQCDVSLSDVSALKAIVGIIVHSGN